MKFDYQPVLQGELVSIRPLRAEDFDDLYSVASDPKIWEQHPVKNRHEKAAFRQFFDEALACGGTVIVLEAETESVIGSSRYHGYSPEAREVEIGWTFLSRSHWGGVYNREIKKLMLKHAFRYAKRVVFLVGLENVRSQRGVEKIGGVRSGIRPDDGGYESYVYQITAEQFAP